MTPTKGRLEVYGAMTGGTVASFGTDGTGISIQRNWPTIGFNQYRDENGVARYMGAGKASILYFEPTNGNFGWDVYTVSGTADQEMLATNAKRALTILNNGNIGVRSGAADNTSLIVERGTNNTTAMIGGSTHHSYFA